MPFAANVLELIGNTPMIEVRRFDTGPCRLFLKLENQNPGGSIKDRIALSMIEAAERDGRVVTLLIEISDSPGVLGTLARTIGEAGGNIIEIHHQRLFYDLPVKRADVDAVVETRNSAHVGEIVQALAAAGFLTRQLIGRS